MPTVAPHVVLPATTMEASGTYSPQSFSLEHADAAVFLLDVNYASSVSGDTLNVRIQHSLDKDTWDDFISFTQVLGDGGAKKFLAFWSGITTPENDQRAPADGSLAAGNTLQGPLGPHIRIKYTVAGSTPTFIAKIKAATMERGY